MNLKNKLYLASSSQSRQRILNLSKIPFEVIKTLSEEKYDSSHSIEEIVKHIAISKMEMAVLPPVTKEGDIIFVLCADTLTKNKNNVVLGKPENLEDAIKKINSVYGKSITFTAFCLEKKIAKNNKWQTLDRYLEVVSGQAEIELDEQYLKDYFENTPGLNCAGAICLEDFGMQFVKTINGSYSAILGLPIFEVRKALEKLEFFK
ncbi:Maf family protein [Candidatus Dependentiae bacterium]|nr:Maf family protein [Candidatus Dependentiae bacterium]